MKTGAASRGIAATTGLGTLFGASALTVATWLFGEPRGTTDYQEFPVEWPTPETAMVVTWAFIPLWSAIILLWRKRPPQGPEASTRVVSLLGLLWLTIFVTLAASLKLIIPDGTYWGELVRVSLGTIVVASVVATALDRTGFTPPRPTTRTALALTFGYLGAAVCTALLVALSRTSSPESYTGNQRGLSVVAIVATMVGSALVAADRTRSKRLPTVATTLLLTLGLVVVAAPAVVVGTQNSDASHVDATTAVAVTPAPLPTSQARQKWTWRSEEDVLAVKAAGAGVVVATESGIVALDGTTGTERWHYHRDDAQIPSDKANLFVLDRGRTVVTTFGRMHQAFDAFTGKELWRDYKISAAAALYQPQATETTLISIDGAVDDAGEWHSQSFVAQNSRTGATTWQWTAKQACGRPEETLANTNFLTTNNMVFLPTLCRGGQSIAGVDARTGQELWRYEAQPDNHPSLESSPFGDAVAIRDSANKDTQLFEARTGKSLGPTPGDFAGADPNSKAVLYTTESGASLTESGHTPIWTYNGTQGSLTTPTEGKQETTFLRDSVAVYTNDYDRLLLLSLDTGAVLQEIPSPPYQRRDQHLTTPPWVVAAPGALVITTPTPDGYSRQELTAFG